MTSVKPFGILVGVQGGGVGQEVAVIGKSGHRIIGKPKTSPPRAAVPHEHGGTNPTMEAPTTETRRGQKTNGVKWGRRYDKPGVKWGDMGCESGGMR